MQKESNEEDNDGAMDLASGQDKHGGDAADHRSPSSSQGGENGAPHSSMRKRKFSVSQSANEASGGWNAPWWLSFIEYPFRVKDPVDGTQLPEAAGWGMDSAGRGPLNQVGGYVGNALLRLAAADVNCPSPRNCNVSVKGGILKPSSLLTATSAIVGVVAAILMPFVGALVDHTKHRKLLGVVSGFIVVLVTGMQISISLEPNNWLFILVLDSIGSFFLLVHTTAVLAYLPDLTTDEESIPKYTAAFNVRQYSTQFIYTSLLLIANKVRGADRSLVSAVQTARDGAGIAFGFSALFFGYAWLFLFRKRPPLSQVPEGQSLFTTGFVQVQTTSIRIWRDYRALRWFMVSLLWSPEAGAGVVLSIAVSFLTVDVKISSTDLIYISLILMVGNVAGAFFSRWATKQINPLNSYRAGLTFLVISLGVSSFIIRGPEQRDIALGMAAWWGVSMGWLYPSQRVLFCTLIPKGQETEMMGLFTFCGQIFGWLPPLIVTVLNENDIELRYGMLVITGFCMLAVCCTLPMGSYSSATEKAATDSEAKLQFILASTMADSDKSNSDKSKRSLDTLSVEPSSDLIFESGQKAPGEVIRETL